MGDLLGLGLVSGIGSLASGLFGASVGQSMSKDMMDYQYKLQQQAINYANWYNSPKQQMMRLASAGLSPNLVYGHGVDGNQSQPASVSHANRNVDLPNPLQDISSFALQDKQYRLQEIAARNAAFESKERQLNLRAKTLGQMLDNSFNSKSLSTRLKSLSQNLINDIQKRDNMVAEEARTWSQTRNLDNQLNVIFEQVKNLRSRTNLTEEQARTEVVRQQSLRAGIHLTEAQARQVAHMIDFIDAGTDLRTQEYEQKGLEFGATDELNKWLADHPNVELTVDIAKEILGALGGVKSGRHRVKRKRRN